MDQITFRIASPCSSEWFNHGTFICHYNDVIKETMASQITSLTTAYSTVYSDADQRKHQSPTSLAFVRGIHRWPVNSPHKWPVTRKYFHLMTSSCWIHPAPDMLNASPETSSPTNSLTHSSTLFSYPSSIHSSPLQWCHNKRHGVSNHRYFDCLFNRFSRRISSKTSKLWVTGLCGGNPQRASNAENVSIWWRHQTIWRGGSPGLPCPSKTSYH